MRQWNGFVTRSQKKTGESSHRLCPLKRPWFKKRHGLYGLFQAAGFLVCVCPPATISIQIIAHLCRRTP
jgi:hypothetical protein